MRCGPKLAYKRFIFIVTTSLLVAFLPKGELHIMFFVQEPLLNISILILRLSLILSLVVGRVLVRRVGTICEEQVVLLFRSF